MHEQDELMLQNVQSNNCEPVSSCLIPAIIPIFSQEINEFVSGRLSYKKDI